jgi:hypothetical protein
MTFSLVASAYNQYKAEVRGRTFLEGLAAPSQSWKNREHVRPHSKNIAPTLTLPTEKKKSGAFIMWILVSGIPLTLSGISLTQYPMCVVCGQ